MNCMNKEAISVVLVEDNPSIRERFEATIKQHPDLMWIGDADSVSSGKQLVLEKRPRVLLVDLGLPDGSGLEIIAEVSQKLPETEIMVVSMFGDEGHVIQAIEAGASSYILKDTDATGVAEHIIQLCEGGSPMSPMIARHLLKRMQGGNSASKPSVAEPQGNNVLTPREMQLLKLLTRGYTYREVARDLEVSSHTVNSHIKNLYRKLSVNTKNEAVFTATRQGLLDMRSLD